MTISKICCIAAGYVGGPSCAVIANKCPNLEVPVMDQSTKRIAQWNYDNLSIFYPSLDEVVKDCREQNFFPRMLRKEFEELSSSLCVNTSTKTFGWGKGRASYLKYCYQKDSRSCTELEECGGEESFSKLPKVYRISYQMLSLELSIRLCPIQSSWQKAQSYPTS